MILKIMLCGRISFLLVAGSNSSRTRAVQEQVSCRTEQVITTPEMDRQHPHSEHEAFPIPPNSNDMAPDRRAEESTMATELEL